MAQKNDRPEILDDASSVRPVTSVRSVTSDRAPTTF
jgi:hypothetical protein